MKACPVCSKPVEIAERHHGTIFNCPFCNAVFFVDWDGNPETPLKKEEMQSQPAPSVPPMKKPAAAKVDAKLAPIPMVPGYSDNISSADISESNSDYQATEQTTDQSNSIPNSDYGVSQTQDFSSLEESAYQPDASYGNQNMETPSSDYAISPEANSGESAYGFPPESDAGSSYSGPGPVAEAAYESPSPIADGSVSFADVEDFGNQDQAASQLTYSVRIGGIHSKEIANLILDVLREKRLQLDCDEYEKTLKSVSSSVLDIKDLPALKAAIIVQQLKDQDLEISWSQNVLGS